MESLNCFLRARAHGPPTDQGRRTASFHFSHSSNPKSPIVNRKSTGGLQRLQRSGTEAAANNNLIGWAHKISGWPRPKFRKSLWDSLRDSLFLSVFIRVHPWLIQFSAECNPPVPARKAMFMRSGFFVFSVFAADRERCCRKQQFDRLCS